MWWMQCVMEIVFSHKNGSYFQLVLQQIVPAHWIPFRHFSQMINTTHTLIFYIMHCNRVKCTLHIVHKIQSCLDSIRNVISTNCLAFQTCCCIFYMKVTSCCSQCSVLIVSYKRKSITISIRYDNHCSALKSFLLSAAFCLHRQFQTVWYTLTVLYRPKSWKMVLMQNKLSMKCFVPCFMCPMQKLFREKKLSQRTFLSEW